MPCLWLKISFGLNWTVSPLSKCSKKTSGRVLNERGLTVFIKYLFNPHTINAATKAKMA